MPKGGVKDFVLSLLPELGTMGSNEGEVWVTGQPFKGVVTNCIQK
jgi:hypothetical protein